MDRVSNASQTGTEEDANGSDQPAGTLKRKTKERKIRMATAKEGSGEGDFGTEVTNHGED